MSISSEFTAQIAGFPSVLRELLEQELAAGNSIVEVASCFPAPPVGAYAKLAKQITTRPRVKTAQLDFYDRDTSIYSGEWTDAKRFFFVLEPPNPPPPEPDMDAIREASNTSVTRLKQLVKPRRVRAGAEEVKPVEAPRPRTFVERFEDSMVIDYEKWHDGVGYDLELLKQATPAELKSIEGILLSRGVNDWRDVEALAALKSEPAKKALKLAMARGKTEIRGAVIRHAPQLVCDDDKISFLTEALRTAQFYGGLTQALDQVAEFHPPEIVAELFRGALERKGEVAIHFAAMLMFIHGKAKAPFDWKHRPFFLRFDTQTHAEREAVFRELCAKIGVKAEVYLPGSS